MKAILLAAGFGTRLQPLTNNIPKCLVSINGRPLLGIWLATLVKLGIKDILINTHYLAHQVENYINQSPYKNHVTLVFEKKLLGTAGTLLENLNFWQGEEVFVAHADNLCICNFEKFLEQHQKILPPSLLTMMTFITDAPQDCGIVNISKQGIVEGFFEKSKENHGLIANGAIYLLSRSFDKKLLELNTGMGQQYDLSTHVLPKLLGEMETWPCDGYLKDIGTPASYRDACSLFKLDKHNRYEYTL